MKYLPFDIETGPETDARLALVEPEFTAPANYKDPEKIAAAIAEKRAAWIADAALSPITGRILAIGWGNEETGTTISGVGFTDSDNQTPTTERDVITDFLEVYQNASIGKFHLVGFNIHGFDLPFIVRRAFILGIPVPHSLRANGQSRFYWPPCFVDLQQVWGAGEVRPAGSLDTICRLLGIGEKSGIGADFAKLYLEPTTQRQALDYLKNDLRLTGKLAERLLG